MLLATCLVVTGDAENKADEPTLRVCHDKKNIPTAFTDEFNDAWAQTKSFYDQHEINIEEAKTNCVTINYQTAIKWHKNHSQADQNNYSLPDSIRDHTYIEHAEDNPNSITRSIDKFQSDVKTNGVTLTHALSSTNAMQRYKRLHELAHHNPKNNTITIRPYNMINAATTTNKSLKQTTSYTYAHEIGHSLLLPHPTNWKQKPNSTLFHSKDHHPTNIMSKISLDTANTEHGYTMSTTQKQLAHTFLNDESQLHTYQDSSDKALDAYWKKHYPETDREQYIRAQSNNHD